MVRYRATTAEDGHATEPGAFTIANYGKVNPTLVDGVKVTPEGRELVLPHGAVFTVADRSFRVEYVWGRTPGHAAGLQRRLDRQTIEVKLERHCDVWCREALQLLVRNRGHGW